jgi:hypothetical protein
MPENLAKRPRKGCLSKVEGGRLLVAPGNKKVHHKLALALALGDAVLSESRMEGRLFYKFGF